MNKIVLGPVDNMFAPTVSRIRFRLGRDYPLVGWHFADC
jgi:hypothetical protein